MDQSTKQEINGMVEAIQDMATREFAESKSSEPFETHVDSGDDHPDRTRLIAKGVQLGLCDHFRSDRISVEVVETGYFIRIKRD
ncbi:hypothetical protein N0B28_10320 [Pseudomonas sp. SD17-1]|uniref:hypothetical protein n=1 Tax=Pseudomonas sp. SD17-1 TaxID=2976883 RepID=UPI0023D9F747|nr:hypothetical protein [Pseudomonas sp. SD17-1]WEJ23645.1 hypothetical protein N0B28_10320 [Pseudomonas sp. SD17-1]